MLAIYLSGHIDPWVLCFETFGNMKIALCFCLSAILARFRISLSSESFVFFFSFLAFNNLKIYILNSMNQLDKIKI